MRVYKICAIHVTPLCHYYCVPIGGTHKDKAGRQSRYKVTLRCFLVPIIAAEKKKVLHILSVCL